MVEILTQEELKWIYKQPYKNKTRIKHTHRELKRAKTDKEKESALLHAKLLNVPIMAKYKKESDA